MAEKNIASIRVTDRQIHQSKNPNVFIVSISDETSANKFSSFPVFANEIKAAKDGFKSIEIDVDRDYDVSKAQAGTNGRKYDYVHNSCKGQAIADMFTAAKEAAVKSKTEKTEVKDTVYLNLVSKKLIHPIEKNGKPTTLVRVSMPDAQSATGMANILVPAANVFQSLKKDKTVIPNMMNVNLGSADKIYKYSITDENKKFIQVEKTAGEIRDLWTESQAVFRQQNVENTVKDTVSEAANHYEYGDDEVLI